MLYWTVWANLYKALNLLHAVYKYMFVGELTLANQL